MTDLTQQKIQDKLRDLANSSLGFSSQLSKPACTTGIFNGHALKNLLINLTAILSNEATKLTLALKPPLDSSTIEAGLVAIESLGDTASQIANVVEMVPTSAGQVYITELREMTKDLLIAIVSLCNSFLVNPIEIEERKMYLMSTGIIWDICTAFKTSLSSSSHDAALKKWNQLSSILADALSELEEGINESNCSEEQTNDNHGDDGWEELLGESERIILTLPQLEVAKQAVNLFKLVKLLFKKVETRCIRAEIMTSNVALWLDRIIEIGNIVVDEGDELGAALYSPETMGSQAKIFAGKAKTLAEVASEEVEEIHVKWLLTCSEQFSKIASAIVDTD